MKRSLSSLIFLGVLAHGDALEAVLQRMDAAAKKFQSVSASAHRVEYNAVLNETEASDGVMRLKKDKNGLVGIIDFQTPAAHTVYFRGHEVRMYYPKANTVEVYDTTKFTGTIDRFLLLGFGTTSAEMKKNYDIKLGGAETLKSGPATRIELTPKSAQLRKEYFTKIELWFLDGQSNPVQEKVYPPSKNYLLIQYSDLKINPSLAASEFEPKLPPGTKEVRPQKSR